MTKACSWMGMISMVVVMGGISLATPSYATTSCDGGYSPTFKLSGDLENQKTITLSDLQSYIPTVETVTFYSGHDGLVTETYVGVTLETLLNDAGVIVDPAKHNAILAKIARITATDCYQVAIGLGEILSKFGAHQVLVAYGTLDSSGQVQPLDASNGMARLVFPTDKAGGRSVFNIRRIRVSD